MKLLVLQHALVEHPGIFRTFLQEDGHQWDTVHLHNGEKLPSLDPYDALWVLGGPMDVWQEEQLPWLIPEKELIQEAVVERGMPYFGLCLGHQLLAEALGGSVGPSSTPEIGVMDVQLTEVGASGVLFDGMPGIFPALQWHSAEVTQVPDGAVCLATSHDCLVQAMSWGPRAYSLQFHLEIESDTVQSWNQIPEYRLALDQALGEEGYIQLEAACEENMTTMNAAAERVYINWLQTSARV